MNRNSHHKTSDQMVEAIFALDLDPIKVKLMDKREGLGWGREEADRHELEYRRFLALIARFPDEVVAPTTHVDKFWHAHILDTMKYAEDCEAVFGYFLHHFPYFGMRDAEDAANLARAAETMRRLYQQEFGRQDAQTTAYCGVVAGKPATPGQSTAYCGVVAAKFEEVSAYCGATSTGYCGVAAGNQAMQKEQAYCGVVAGKSAEQDGQTAYCGVSNTSYCGVIAGKGRPKLQDAEHCAA
ncbi:hypothetical protein GCM10027343_41480 [Noviherbaspirillum agri]